MLEKMLDGKVAIVSGASYGMGFSMAQLFAKEGAKVVMTARGKESWMRLSKQFVIRVLRSRGLSRIIKILMM